MRINKIPEPKWELVFSEGLKQDAQKIYKMKIKDGWIYKVNESKYSIDSIGYEVMSICFVPDKGK